MYSQIKEVKQDFMENIIYYLLTKSQASLVTQSVKNLPAMQETQVHSLGWKDPLEKEMATCSSILAWEIPQVEEPSGLQSMEPQESDMTQQLTTNN